MKKFMKNIFKELMILFVCLAVLYGIMNYSTKETKAQTHYSSFSDVENNLWSFWYIESVFTNEIMDACNSNNFCPTGSVSRELMALYIARVKGLSAYRPSIPTFVDVPTTHAQYGYIEAVNRAGYMQALSIFASQKYFSPTNPMYGPYHTTGSVERDEEKTLIVIQRALGRIPEIPPNFNWQDNTVCTYGCPDITSRGQLAALLAWNFNLSPKISGTAYKTVLDENNQPVYGDDILSGAIIKIWNNASTTNPDIILRADENGHYNVNLNIRKVTNNLKIQSHDPDKNFPAVTIGLQLAYNKSLISKTYARFNSYWNIHFVKRSDCSANLYTRIIQVSNQEHQHWIDLALELDRKHPEWTDDQVLIETDLQMRLVYVGKDDFCCTGFATWVLTKAGLVDRNNRSFFYTTQTTLPASDRRIVGAITLREWFARNNDKELVTRDGNIYRVKLSPKTYLLQNLSKLEPGEVYMALSSHPAAYSGHSAIFIPEIDRTNLVGNTMNCDGPEYLIGEADRYLEDTLFYGAGRFECVNTSSAAATIRRIFR